MNISALWVFVFAVMSARVYANIRCSDCNNPCPADEWHNVTEEFTKIMSIPQCRNIDISNNGNPKWRCKQSKRDIYRTPQTYSYAKCEKCENGAELEEISQDFKMLFRQSCDGHHNHNRHVLELKNVTVSLGCVCVKR